MDSVVKIDWHITKTKADVNPPLAAMKLVIISEHNEYAVPQNI